MIARRLGERMLLYGPLTLGAIVMVLPFFYMVVTSLKPEAETTDVRVRLWVDDPSIESYGELLEATNFVSAAVNSTIIAVVLTAGNLLLCPLAGYAFAKHRFPGRDALFLLLLSTMMIPGTVLLVPGFLLMRDLGWLDSWLPLIVPTLAAPFGVFLSRQFISTIPDALLEAARIDGSSELRIVWRIVFPLSGPLLATLGIFTFLGSWNNFLWPLIVLRSEELYTIPLVIALLQGRFVANENVQMAGAALSMIPVLVVFFVFQQRIVSSLASTGLKG